MLHALSRLDKTMDVTAGLPKNTTESDFFDVMYQVDPEFNSFILSCLEAFRRSESTYKQTVPRLFTCTYS